MLDDIDRRLLGLLQQDGRATQTELAARVGLSLPALGERLRKLETRGIIRGYTALISPDVLGLGMLVYVRLSLDHMQYREAERAFLDAVATDPQVQECHHVAGEDSYLLKVRTRGTADLAALLSRLKELPGVTRTHSTIVLNTTKETLVLPVGE